MLEPTTYNQSMLSMKHTIKQFRTPAWHRRRANKLSSSTIRDRQRRSKMATTSRRDRRWALSRSRKTAYKGTIGDNTQIAELTFLIVCYFLQCESRHRLLWITYLKHRSANLWRMSSTISTGTRADSSTWGKWRKPLDGSPRVRNAPQNGTMLRSPKKLK